MNTTEKEVTASYEDALCYLGTVADDGFKEVVEKSDGKDEMMARLLVFTHEHSAAQKAVAFCFGKSNEEVAKDLMLHGRGKRGDR